MDDGKQSLFLSRILFLHDRASSRGGKASSARLAPVEWNNEVERMSLAYYIIEQMKIAVTHEGDQLFDPDALAKARKRAINGRLIAL